MKEISYILVRIKSSSNKIKRFFELMYRWLNPNILSKYASFTIVPDRIISYSFTQINSFILSYFYKKKRDIIFSVGEDGIRDYIYKDFGIVEPKLFLLIKEIRAFLGIPLITIPKNYNRLLYRPDARKRIITDDTDICIKMYKGENLAPIIADIFNNNIQFIKGLLEISRTNTPMLLIQLIMQRPLKLKEEGTLKKKPVIRSFRKLDPEKLKIYLKDHADAYLREIAAEFGCCETTVTNACRKLKITRKKRPRIIKSKTPKR